MQIESSINDAACEAFGLRNLRGGKYTEPDANGYQQPVLWIDYIWLAIIEDSYWATVTLGVAATHPYGIRSETNLKGILLVNFDKDTYLGARPFQALELGEFIDPIPNLLRQVDLLPKVRQVALDDPEGAVRLTIHTFVDWGSGALRFERGGLPIDDNGVMLWERLKMLIHKFGEMSKDENVRAYIAKGPKPT
jgi:hypothetical protein